MEQVVKQCIHKRDFKILQSILQYLQVKEDTLHEILKKNQIEELKIILSMECRRALEYKNQEMETPLHVAAKLGCNEIIKLLLQKNPPICSVDKMGRTPIFVALEHKYLNIAIAIARKGESCTESLNEPYRLYFQFCVGVLTKGSTFIQSFVERKKQFDVDFKDLKRVDTPLILAILNQRYYDVITLIQAGANINFRRGPIEYSALHIAVLQGNCDLVHCLLRVNADVNCILSIEMPITPLHLAAEIHGKILTKMLLKKGAQVDNQATDGYFGSPLHYAVLKDNLASCQILLKHKAKVNHKDGAGNTALHLAISRENKGLTDILLKFQADIEARNIYGKSSLLVASEIRNEKSLFHFVKKLMELEGDIFVQDKNGNTFLHNACQSESIIEFISTNYMIPFIINWKNTSGQTVAHHIHEIGCDHLVKLLRLGLDLNAADKDGNRCMDLPADFVDIQEIEDPEAIPHNLNCSFVAFVEQTKLLGYNLHQELERKYEIYFCCKHGFEQTEITIERFIEELEEMKMVTICINPKITLYSWLFLRQHRNLSLSKNKIIKNIYDENNFNFSNRYTHFGWLMNLQYNRGQLRKNLIQNAREVIENSIEINLGDIFMEIVKYLKNEDLANLMEKKIIN